ncbi:MAG TPA: DNA ligase D [Chitinophagaceae bacterium]|nr:DNA ligase D [Chitinophagaceae bacterium]
MALETYQKKRSFGNTPEPKGGKSKDQALRFVIQKHDASRLHYDFRLEMEGVLKSWAVPKGPSLDPSVKRLAMMVEDHPYDYKDFEGIIPEGNYGAGTVILWDEGTYSPIDDSAGKAAQEKSLLKQLKAGSLKFTLKGKKLKGEFALVKTKGMAENSWLLIKHRDKYATDSDITGKDKSVVSGKTIEKMAGAPDRVYGAKKSTKASSAKKKPAKKNAKKKTTAKAASESKTGKREAKKEKEKEPAAEQDNDGVAVEDVAHVLKKAPEAAFPKNLSPMLATLVDEPFDDPDWEYEVKWDGYRALAFKNKGKTELRSRNDKSFNDKFYPVYEAVKQWGEDAVIDGEIVVVDTEKGISHFNKLQNWRSEADGQLLYYVFDVLWYKGKLLVGLSLRERMAVLKSIIPQNEESLIRAGFSVTGAGNSFFATAQKLGLEGIIAKRLDSKYIPGDRTRNWLKIKVHKRQEVIITGFTHNDGSPKLFSSLLLGVYNNKRLEYVGKVGTGFNNRQQKEMMAQFKPLIIKKSPLEDVPDYNKPSRFRPNPPHASATWLSPELVCEINYTEVTEDGVFRHPSFVGMRSDKSAKEVVREKEASTETVVEQAERQPPVKKQSAKKGGASKKAKTSGKAPAVIKPPAKGGRKTLLNPSDETQVRRVNGHELKFTNLSKIFWPKEKVTKRDLINYYYQVAPIMLAYLKERPQSLNRHPDGIGGKSFYQKDVTGKVPDWMDTYLYHSEGDKSDKHFLLANNEATLLYMAGLGCIEMNPWSSTVKKPDYPTWCIIDLDPDKHSFDKVIEAAQVTRQVLDELGISGYPKTSGSTGIHVYIPLGSKYTYEQSKEFARVVVTLVHQRIPRYTSLERNVSNRKGKMYLDFLQNRPQATIAAPYSLRPKPGATVSMPLHWEEVKKGMQMKDFTIFNTMERIRSEGDIFKPVLGKGIDLQKIIETFSENS